VKKNSRMDDSRRKGVWSQTLRGKKKKKACSGEKIQGENLYDKDPLKPRGAVGKPENPLMQKDMGAFQESNQKLLAK